MVMALGLEISKALIYVTHKMQINSQTFHGPLFLFTFGSSCPPLSTHVTCPFHQTYPHSVIKGLGSISFLNLALWGGGVEWD